MGCCPSKWPDTTPGKEYAATPSETAPILLAGSANRVKPVVDNAVEDTLMDRSDEEPGPEVDEPAGLKLPPERAKNIATRVRVRCRESAAAELSPPSPPRKSLRNADDIPISSTYHRVHCAEVADQEAKRQEQRRLEAVQLEREMREYKAAMQMV